MRKKSVLRTKEMRDQHRAKKLEKYKKCYIRIRFPDRTELQAVFAPLEKPAAIYDFLKECLKEENLKEFYLYTIPPKNMLKYDNPTNFRDLSYLPAALVHFGIPEGSQMVSPFLKDELIKNIKEKLNPTTVFIPKSDQNFVINIHNNPPPEPEEKK